MINDGAYNKHLNFMSTVINFEDIEDSIVEKQYQLLLDFIPSGGKLYKYRSLQGKSFSRIYDALKKGYIWMPTADTLNDDFDSIMFSDPIKQQRVLIDYICKDEDKLLYFLTKRLGKEKWEQKKLLSKIPFSEYLQCFSPDTYSWDINSFINDSFQHADDKLAAIDEIRSIVDEMISLIPRPEKFIKWTFERNKEAYKKIHVFSLSEGYDLDNMWGYYADSGRGFCIEYDFTRGSRLSIGLKKFLLNIYRANYSDEHAFFDIEAFWEKFFFENESEEHLTKIMNSTINQLVSKSKCWEHEREWRLVVGECDSKVHVDIVSAIIIDERSISTKNAKKLISLCEKRGWELKVRSRSVIGGEHIYMPYEKYLQK